MEVKLIDASERPMDGSVAAARSCYSPRVITKEDVYPDEARRGDGWTQEEKDKFQKKAEKRDNLAKSIFRAGHHTTVQHATFTFTLSGISRQSIWSFFHSHPWYNSEQVSQRYVEVSPDQVLNPYTEFALAGGADASTLFDMRVAQQMEEYQQLVALIEPVVAEEYHERFPDREGTKMAKSAINKKALEVARYVLPIGTLAHMYHTVSLLTLIRMWHARRLSDVPTETDIIVSYMVREVLRHDPNLVTFFGPSLLGGKRPEVMASEDRGDVLSQPQLESHDDDAVQRRHAFFDKELHGMASRLVSYTEDLTPFYEAIAEVTGAPFSSQHTLNAEAAVMGALEYGGPEALNMDHHHPLRRAMAHVHYTFKHRLSHTADSQDQRHRTTPASRPMLSHTYRDFPDFITPTLIKRDKSGNIQEAFEKSMADTWEAFRTLKGHLGFEMAQYILPNALALRYTESGDLAAIRHKMSMRLCMNAQEEIFRIAVEETQQISEVHPTIGKYLVPPCTRRKEAGVTPKCPEGDRYCGVSVWKNPLDDLVEERGIL